MEISGLMDLMAGKKVLPQHLPKQIMEKKLEEMYQVESSKTCTIYKTQDSQINLCKMELNLSELILIVDPLSI
jgi:hypothetical protein